MHQLGFPQASRDRLKSLCAGWRPVMGTERALAMTVEWTQAVMGGADARVIIANQLNEYSQLAAEQRD
jgi:hypothetical protein